MRVRAARAPLGEQVAAEMAGQMEAGGDEGDGSDGSDGGGSCNPANGDYCYELVHDTPDPIDATT